MSDLLRRAADASACSMLADIGTAATQLGAWTLWAPKAALVPLTIGGLSYMANNLLCQPTEGPPPADPQSGGCQKKKPGKGGKIIFKPCDVPPEDVLTYCSPGGPTNVNEILYVNAEPVSASVRYTIGYRTVTGETGEVIRGTSAGKTFYISGPSGDCEEFNEPDPPSEPDFDPYPWTDPETNCNYTLKLEGFVQQYENGPVNPVWNIRSADTRTDGGRMGGCNLEPTIFIGGDGDGDRPGPPGPPGPPRIPVPPSPPVPGPDGVPWWVPALVGATGGALLNQLANLAADTFNYPTQPGAFTFVAPCDKLENGTNEYRTWSWGQEPLILRLHTHQVAMMEMLQQHLNWKTPTCSSEKPPLEGSWVTTRWESLEKMAHSGKRLRKLFRYRSKSTRDLGQLSAYWEDFTWQSGDVCVIHKGAWWGTPQIWAASEEEGKRVIRFAAGEAGIDPDQVGEWTIGSSRSPRFGMSGTMKIQHYKGYPWVASRDGEAWPNTLAKTRDP